MATVNISRISGLSEQIECSINNARIQDGTIIIGDAEKSRITIINAMIEDAVIDSDGKIISGIIQSGIDAISGDAIEQIEIIAGEISAGDIIPKQPIAISII